MSELLRPMQIDDIRRIRTCQYGLSTHGSRFWGDEGVPNDIFKRFMMAFAILFIGEIVCFIEIAIWSGIWLMIGETYFIADTILLITLMPTMCLMVVGSFGVLGSQWLYLWIRQKTRL